MCLKQFIRLRWHSANEFSKAFETKCSSFVECLKSKGYEVLRDNSLTNKERYRDSFEGRIHKFVALIVLFVNALKFDSQIVLETEKD